MPSATSAAPAAAPGSARRMVVCQTRLERRAAQSHCCLLQLDRRLGDAGAQADQRTRQEQQHIGDQHGGRRLVERQRHAHRDRDQRQRHDHARQAPDDNSGSPPARAARRPGARTDSHAIGKAAIVVRTAPTSASSSVCAECRGEGLDRQTPTPPADQPAGERDERHARGKQRHHRRDEQAQRERSRPKRRRLWGRAAPEPTRA